MRKGVILVFIFMMLFFWNACSSICESFGAHDFGNNLTLLEGDRTEDRVIVYCTGRSAGCCDAGIPVIPSRVDTLSQYVQSATADLNWIIAKTVNKDKSKGYWIIDKNFKIDLAKCDVVNCDSIIQSHIIGPLDSTDFEEKIKVSNINLHLTK